MSANRVYHELLLVVLRNHEWRRSGGIAIERSQVVDMGRPPFSIYQVLDCVDEGSFLYHLVRASVSGE